MDTYLTLSEGGEASYTEKRSKFYAFAEHVSTEDEAKQRVAALKKKFYDARHVCFAYVLGFDGAQTRSNDDGEPSGTAGRPILGALRSAGITFALVAVVRYFGGVKLGTGGLVVAYREAAAAAIAAATVEERLVMSYFKIDVPYADSDVAMRFIRDGGGEISARDYSAEGAQLTVSVRKSCEAPLRERLHKILSLKFPDENTAAED